MTDPGSSILRPPAPLDLTELAGLVPDAGEARHRLLLRASGGNPRYLRALVAVDDESVAALCDTPGVTDERPDDAVLDLLRTELDGLDGSTRAVLRAAAIAGADASLGLIGAVAEADERTVADVLDTLAAVDLLTPEGGGLRFRHPLLRTAAYWDAGAGWRVRAHRRAADYLSERDGPRLLLAYHTEKCAEYGDERAVDILRDAADVAILTAPATATRLLRRAVAVMPDRSEFIGARLDLQMALARALGVTGELAASRQLLGEVTRVPGEHRTRAIAFSSAISRLLGGVRPGSCAAHQRADRRRPDQPGNRSTARRVGRRRTHAWRPGQRPRFRRPGGRLGERHR